MTLAIKNMVCNRCVRVVREELEALGLPVRNVALGEVLLERELSPEELSTVRARLAESGFELIDDKRARLIEQIKKFIINEIHHQHGADEPQTNLSDRLARALGRDYTYLSTLFSSVEDQTIEQFVIRQKIERVKELLVYDELTLSEIAWQLGYSSVQHLSTQFKKVTGFTPTHYKNLREFKRLPLDQV
jgi:AraC-like DNA-binding protein